MFLNYKKTLSEGSNCSMSACYLLWTNHTQRDGNIIPKRYIFHISNLHLFTSKRSYQFIRFSTEYLLYHMISFRLSGSQFIRQFQSVSLGIVRWSILCRLRFSLDQHWVTYLEIFWGAALVEPLLCKIEFLFPVS